MYVSRLSRRIRKVLWKVQRRFVDTSIDFYDPFVGQHRPLGGRAEKKWWKDRREGRV